MNEVLRAGLWWLDIIEGRVPGPEFVAQGQLIDALRAKRAELQKTAREA